MRRKLYSSNKDNAPVLYRDSLDVLLQSCPKTTQSFEAGKPLLLNDLSSDKYLGDVLIQPFIYYEKSDNTHTILLNPGSPLEQLSFTVGMSIFEADSINEVLNSIIFNMSNLLVYKIIPNSKLQNTPQLLADIRRYLYFYFYGE